MKHVKKQYEQIWDEGKRMVKYEHCKDKCELVSKQDKLHDNKTVVGTLWECIKNKHGMTNMEFVRKY